MPAKYVPTGAYVTKNTPPAIAAEKRKAKKQARRAAERARARKTRRPLDPRLTLLDQLRALPGGPYVRHLWSVARIRATARGTAFSLSDEWQLEASRVLSCPITGMPFDESPPQPGQRTNPLSRSLDRIDSAVGYTDANTRVVSVFANLAKNSWSEAQFRMLLLAAAENLTRH